MSIVTSISKRTLHFGFNARTSRGAINQRVSWLIKIWDDNQPQQFGIGECGPLPGLSIDDTPDYEDNLHSVLNHVQSYQSLSVLSEDLHKFVPPNYPSVLFGMETALLDLTHGGKRVIYKNAFLDGMPIPINGLVWMGDAIFMRKQISEKILQGYTCLKLKVGGIDFVTECEVIAGIRDQFGDDVTIRLDANGSFKSNEALSKLELLSSFNIQSIEQPVMAGDPELASICMNSPIPIALDEELIMHTDSQSRLDLLNHLKPQFIILKPSLHGGLRGCAEWIRMATEAGIGWWITSALESNIGLNAICQFTANYNPIIPQGLGTGALYSDNVSSPLTVRNGTIFYDHHKIWDI
ncbi:MAG: o-succinylbenzoate synthase [Chryseolinea sp.]